MKTFILDNLIRPNIKAMKAYSSARSEYTTDDDEVVFLDANENPFDTGFNRYPDPNQTALKEKLGRLKGVNPRKILLGNGSDEVLDLIFRAFCEPGVDNIITLPPTYGMYDVLAKLNDIKNKEVLLTPKFKLDLDAVLNAIDSTTKLIFICSPNNPTGNLIAPSKIEQLASQFNGLILIDEAYIDFSTEVSWIKRLDEFPNLVITQTLSKAYGMAGIRIGSCFASEEIIQVLKKIKPPYNINTLSQKKAIKRLADSSKVKKEIQRINEQKAILAKKMLDVFFVKKVYPSEANFLLVKVDDAKLRYKQLVRKGVIVRNRSSQPHCENTLRLTVGTSEENRILFKALNSIQA